MRRGGAGKRGVRGAIAGLLAALVWSAPGWAAPHWCRGTASNLYVGFAGEVTFIGSWRSGYTTICNLEQPWKGVSTNICRNWVAIVMQAIARGKQLIVFYPDIQSCDSIPIYGEAPMPGYVMQVD